MAVETTLAPETGAGPKPAPPLTAAWPAPEAARITAAAWAVWLFLAGNAVAVVWLWYHGGNVDGVHSTGELLTSIARITGLLGAYLALVQVVLLARLPAIERQVGFDRLTVWHRWNGHALPLPDPRARVLLDLGLRRHRPVLRGRRRPRR